MASLKHTRVLELVKFERAPYSGDASCLRQQPQRPDPTWYRWQRWTVNGPDCFWEVLMGALPWIDHDLWASIVRTKCEHQCVGLGMIEEEWTTRTGGGQRTISFNGCYAWCKGMDWALGSKWQLLLKQYWFKHCSVTAIHFMADHHRQNSVFHPDTATVYFAVISWVLIFRSNCFLVVCRSVLFEALLDSVVSAGSLNESQIEWMNESDEPSLQVPVASDWCQVWGWYGVGCFLIVISCDSWSCFIEIEILEIRKLETCVKRFLWREFCRLHGCL